MSFTRRDILALASSAAILRAQTAPAPPVSIARCASYDEDLVAILGRMFDQIGGLQKLVGNKTVTMELNLTGSPGLRFQGKPLGVTHGSGAKFVNGLCAF